MVFYNANDRNLDFFCNVDVFLRSNQFWQNTLCDLGCKTLFDPVSKINSRSWVGQFSNMMGYLGEFFQDLCEIPIESHWNYRRIQM